MCHLFLTGTLTVHPTPGPLPRMENICTYVLLFVCVLAKWCCFLCMYLNLLINVIELYISFSFLPFSLITIFFKFIHVAMATIHLLSLNFCSLLCSVHSPRLSIQSPDDRYPDGLRIPGTSTNAAPKYCMCPLGSCVSISSDYRWRGIKLLSHSVSIYLIGLS